MLLIAVFCVLAAFLCGMLLSVFFNVFVLVPVSAAVLAGGTYMVMRSPLWFLGVAVVAIVALQAGYMAGSVFVHRMRRPGLFKKKPVSRVL